jgi:hypothetical protein
VKSADLKTRDERVASLLDQLDRRESVLLMHIAGELPAGDRAEVERRLAADPALAADLERLRSIHDDFIRGLARLDAADPLPVEPAVAAKRVGDVLRQRLAHPAARRARPAAGTMPYDIPRRIVGWAAVAAAIAIAASVAPQLAQLWRSDSGLVAKGPRNGGGVQIQQGDDLEREINRLAFGKWARPDEDLIAELAEATEEMRGTAQPDVPEAGPIEEAGGIEIASGQGLGDGPIFDIPIDDPEPAQP